jgi:twitching motility two-component system response regulator PilG
MLPRTYYLAPEEEHDNIEKLAETFAIEEKANTDNIASISKIVLRQPVKISKIICIDDSESMLGIISSYLGNEDFQITLIQDSMKALMKINSICPDLILLDIGMPNVDGYQLCSLIRKSSNFKHIPIVMVTANKGLINRARANIAGATDYLTKPFNQADLLKMVMRHLM